MWVVSDEQRLYQLTNSGISHVPIQVEGKNLPVVRVAVADGSLLLIAVDESGANLLLTRDTQGRVTQVALDSTPRFAAFGRDGALYYVGTDTRLRVREGGREVQVAEHGYGLMVSAGGRVALRAIETDAIQVGDHTHWEDRGPFSGEVLGMRADGALLLLKEEVSRKGERTPESELLLSSRLKGKESDKRLAIGAVQYAVFSEGGVTIFEHVSDRLAYRSLPLE